jgi:hypothetical protein
MHPPHPLRAAGLLALAVSVPLIAGCGDDDKGKSAKPAAMSITTSDAGAKKFKMTAPSSVEGGLVNVTFHNASKTPHEAQLVKIDGHTAQQALKVVEPDKVVLPDWFFAYGGVATTPPGKSATVTVKLPPGDYAVIDDANDSGPSPSSQGAVAEFKVTGDNDGDIKDTSSKVEVKKKGDDEFEFVTSGLTAGTNNLTFHNTTDEIHHIQAFPVKGNATLADVKKFLATMGKPSGPPPIDFPKGTGTSVIDGKQTELTPLKLAKGRNVLLCFLTDRDGKGKSHFQEGMIKEVDVQ